MKLSMQSTRVLVTEDDRNTLKLVCHTMREAGFSVVTAQSGKEALQVMRDKPVDIILSDILMPEMDGFTLLECIRADPFLRDLPFVFLTAKAQSHEQIQGLRSGVDDYVTKPFDPYVLVARVQAVIERRRRDAEMLRTDALTHLLNRVSAERDIMKELERLRRYDGVSCLVLLDIDNFKRINDTCGHQTGDLVLVRLADVLRKQFRDVDTVGRYGGEEFIGYMPETSASEAMTACERILEACQMVPFPSEVGSVSFSAGIAEAPSAGVVFETLCSRADDAMYEAKRQGKARTVIWSKVTLRQAAELPNADGGETTKR